MKRRILFAVLLLMLPLAACSAQSKPSAAAPGQVIISEDGAWPVNEYTEGLPIPAGIVVWELPDAAHGTYSISLTQISEAEFQDYLARLTQAGFSVLEEAAEAVGGQDYVSVGTLLSNGELDLSISFVPDSLTIYVSFSSGAL